MTCPHCFTERVAFQSISSFQYPDSTTHWTVAFVCRCCWKGVIADVTVSRTVDPHKAQGDLSDVEGVEIHDTYPAPPVPEIPAHVPEAVARCFFQAVDALHREHWESAGMMFRKALDLSTKGMAPERANDTLYGRIEFLETRRLITPELRDWAHAIRDDGNEAAHESKELAEEIALDLMAFTDLYLRYVYTLPAMLRERKAARDAAKQAAKP